jgi:hypothetical protein
MGGGLIISCRNPDTSTVFNFEVSQGKIFILVQRGGGSDPYCQPSSDLSACLGPVSLLDSGSLVEAHVINTS